MEATGVYWERVAVTLHDQGYTVCVVNPAQIKFFAKSTLRRGKTDTMDAEIIARYGATMHPAPWHPTPADVQQLRDLLHERDVLLELRTLESNRLHAFCHRHTTDTFITSLGEERLTLLDLQLHIVDAAIRTCTDSIDGIREQIALLCSVPGVGRLTAAILLTETAHLDKMEHSRQWAAFAGLSPVLRQSGTMVGKSRISKIGNARLRRGLYMCAVSASRMQTPQGDFYRRLVKAGKPKKVALIALARKLLRICFAVLRSGIPYAQGYVRQGQGELASSPCP
ncbi:IS110 family transposase [Deinococcus peraridilitoris]|uniref:IS110 family transposase n=1 Tax=Deinococcus peraridilitoris TaxID=432329 RepID=UPI001FDF4D78|nr:IS110 family transposase [Deinococcus peraridilitoris]